MAGAGVGGRGAGGRATGQRCLFSRRAHRGRGGHGPPRCAPRRVGRGGWRRPQARGCRSREGLACGGSTDAPAGAGAGRAPLLCSPLAGWGGAVLAGPADPASWRGRSSAHRSRHPAPPHPRTPASRHPGIPGEGVTAQSHAEYLAKREFSELLIQIDFLFGFRRESGPDEVTCLRWISSSAPQHLLDALQVESLFSGCLLVNFGAGLIALLTSSPNFPPNSTLTGSFPRDSSQPPL